jgi:phosphoglycerate dehydrogenase-like enzyme
MKYKILFCSKQYRETPIAVKKFLDNEKYFIENCKLEELPEKIKQADVAVPLMSRLDEKIINSAEKLKLIQQFGVGLEGVDIASATEKKIFVANVPADNTGNAYSVSELTLFFILALLKNYKRSIQCFNERTIGYPVGDTLLDKNFLVIGYGNVGKAIVNMLNLFNVGITVAVRNSAGKCSSHGNVKFVELEKIKECVGEYDFVIAALALNAETKDFINEDIIFNMKKNAFLINVARGGVVKYNALLKALKTEIIKGAAMDVFWNEPFDPNDEILNYNVIVTPHIAGSTFYSYNLMAKIVADNIIKVLEKGLPPDNWANPF